MLGVWCPVVSTFVSLKTFVTNFVSHFFGGLSFLLWIQVFSERDNTNSDYLMLQSDKNEDNMHIVRD